jgi:hypothetical protein
VGTRENGDGSSQISSCSRGESALRTCNDSCEKRECFETLEARAMQDLREGGVMFVECKEQLGYLLYEFARKVD